MNTSNKTLLQILVEELPKLSPVPYAWNFVYQDWDKELRFDGEMSGIYPEQLASNHRCAKLSSDDPGFELVKVTRDQYEAALAASKAVVGHNGWIDWHGGECPVDSDAIVEVKYRKPSPYQFNNDRAGDFTWSHDGFGGDIIAYRLQQPHEVKAAGKDKVTKKFTEPKAPKAPKAKPETIQPPFGKDKLTRLADLAVHIELVHSDERLEDAEPDESMTLRAPAGVVREFMALVADYVGGVPE